MSKYTYRLSGDLATVDKTVKMLKRMAAKGYSPVAEIAGGVIKFEKSAPSTDDFSIDTTSFKKDTEEFADYLEVFEGSDWQYLFSWKTCHYFRAPEGTEPIYTTEADKLAEGRRRIGWYLMTILQGIATAFIGAVLAILLVLTWPDAPQWAKMIFGGVQGAGIGLVIVGLWGTAYITLKNRTLDKQGA